MDIRLRKLEPTDLPFLYQWENDVSAWADSDNHNPLSQQDLRAYIESTTGDIYRDGQLRLMIVSVNPTSSADSVSSVNLTSTIGDESSNPISSRSQSICEETLGCIDLFDLDVRNRKAAIGMYIAPSARNKGVGETAVRLLEDYAFGFLNLRLLYAIISTRNQPCSNLYSRLGYIPSSPLKYWTLEAAAIIWQKHNPICIKNK